jgi:hypothetical protein
MTDTTKLRAAGARAILGIAQLAAATTSLILLARTGVISFALGAVVITCLLTSTSVFFFGRKSPRSLRDGSAPETPRQR